MKCKFFLLVLICGFSISVQAKFFHYEQTGFKTRMDAGKFSSQSEETIANPKFVYAAGSYHSITSNTYPFYTPHDTGSYYRFCYKPNTSLPLGTLWRNSFGESNTTYAKSGWLGYNSNTSFNYKLCPKCKRPASKPSTAIHLRSSEKLVFYFNGSQ